MNNINDYFFHIKSLIILNSAILNWRIIREDIQSTKGFFRYKLTLKDGSILEMFEFIQITITGLKVDKYSFHWQNIDGTLRKRWDNAPHHRDISTYPHHLHDSREDNILPHQPVTAEYILSMISAS